MTVPARHRVADDGGRTAFVPRPGLERAVAAALDDGADLGTVLLRARQLARGDRVQTATAAAYLAMGA